MNAHPSSLIRRCVVLPAIVIALAVSALAQDPTVRTITRYRIKADRVGDFRAAVKEYNDILKQANWDQTMTVWTAASGPPDFWLVREFKKWADLDLPPAQDPRLKDVRADLTRIGTRISQCTEFSERVIEEIVPTLSLPRSGGDYPKLARVVRTNVKPERVDEYTALLASEILPAAKKANLKVFRTTRTRFGGPATEIRTVSEMSGWGDLDQPSAIVKAMGEDNYKKFLAKRAAMVVDTQWDVYRFQPDLSYLPAATISQAK